MTDTEDNGAALAMQDAIVATLTADTRMKTLMGAEPRVLDRVQDRVRPVYPYVKIGADQALPDLAEGIDGTEFLLAVDVYSQAVGSVECKRIAAAIDTALHGKEADIALNDYYALKIIERSTVIYRSEADNVTHAVMTFRALVEPAL